MNEFIILDKNLTLDVKPFVANTKQYWDTLTVMSRDVSSDLKTYLEDNNANFVDESNLALQFNVNSLVSSQALKLIYTYLYIKNISTSTNIYLCFHLNLIPQQNPFNIIKNNKPYLLCTNKNCTHIAPQINACYGSDILNMLHKHELLSGKCIMGNRLAVVDLFKEMVSDMTHIVSRVEKYENVFQSCLNKTVHFDKHRYNILTNQERDSLYYVNHSK